MPLLKKASVVISLVASAGLIGAQNAQSDVVVVRAAGPQLDANTVRLIADNFEPFHLPDALTAILPQSTPDQVIAALCGSVNSAYYDYFLKANQAGNIKIDHNTPLGVDASKITWPKCLMVATSTLTPGPTPNSNEANSSPFVAGTGSTRREIGSTPGLSISDLFNSRTGYIAPPVELTPKPGITVQQAAELLKRKGVGILVSPPTAKMSGHIVAEALPENIDPTDTEARDCVAEMSPFNSKAVQNAYQWSQNHRTLNVTPGVANIYVIDNGFLGDDPANPGQFGAAFPKYLFWDWAATGGYFGPSTRYGGKEYWPSNHQNPDASTSPDPTAAQAHGTHVAGLTLGGPSFAQSRDQLFAPNGNSSPIRLTIANIGIGKPDLLDDSETLIQGLLSSSSGVAPAPADKIVNMSLAYEGSQADGIFTGIFRHAPNTLFVVAAGNASPGNRTVNVNSGNIYPAKLGSLENVLTVAAHDSAGHIAWFSNYSDTAVDITAPGCAVKSWYNTAKIAPITGTSQATPIVVFAASLLKTLDSSLSPRQIKARLMSSGDLLTSYRWNIVSGSQLNITESLLIFDDVVERVVPAVAPETNDNIEILIGDVEISYGIRCSGDNSSAAGKDLSAIWALKAEGVGASQLIYNRDVDGQMNRCAAASTGISPGPDPFIEFHVRAKFVGDALIEVGPMVERIPISQINKLLLKGPYYNHG